MFLKKEKDTRVKRWSAFEQLRPVEPLLRQSNKSSFYTPEALWPVSPQKTGAWEEPYDITLIMSLQNPYDTRFKSRFRCTQPLISKYAIIIAPSTLSPQLLPVCLANV